MSTRQDTARLLFGGIESATRRTLAMGSSSVRRGTAQSDSSGGKVSVLLDGSTQAVDLRCILPVKKGQRGTIVYQGGTYTFIALEQLTEDTKNNSKAIEEAEKTLKEAQDDLAELDERLIDLNKSLAEMNQELKKAMDQLDKDLDALNAQLDSSMKSLDAELDEMNKDMDPTNKDGKVGSVLLAAQTAQKTADGKNKVYVQAGQPSGTFVEGDLWRKTDSSGNIIGEYVWNGSSWAKHFLTADTMLVGTIVAADAFVQALRANKLTANEINVASVVSRSALINAIGTNKLTANEVSAASIVSRSVISSVLKADKLTVNEINVDEIAANAAFIAKLVAQNITAAKLQVADDDSFAQIIGGTLTLYSSSKKALSKIAASYASFCQGALTVEVSSTSSTLKNTLGGPLVLSSSNLVANGSFASPRGTATMASNAKMGLSSNEVVIPFTSITGEGMSLYGNGVKSTGTSGNVVSGFAMFEGVGSGKNCCLALYEGSTQIAEAVSTSAGDFCMVSIGPIARPSRSNVTYYLKARTGGGGGNIGGGSDANLKAALTVWT